MKHSFSPLRWISAPAVAVVFSVQAHGAVIISNISGTETLGGSGYQGHSFTIPAGQSYHTITFSWLSAAGNPLAAGQIFLLSQEYLGNPSSLSSSTPGYIAVSTSIASSAYVFHPSVTLAAGTKYWVYMDATSSLANGGYGSVSLYSGGQPYEQFSSSSQPFFSNNSFDFNFRLSGEPVPEPSAPLLGSAAVALFALARRRRA